MKKTEIASKFRNFVRENLSPTAAERSLIQRLYQEMQSALPGQCLLIGSYARFTAGRPVHDLDVLFLAGGFDPNHLDPGAVLAGLHDMLKRKFKNPTGYALAISQQSHSITISFTDGQKEVIAIDVVPAFVSGRKNEFGDDIYIVPEIIMVSRRRRAGQYETISKAKKSEREWWLLSDPRGYIRATSNLNTANPDFRKAAKFIKRWKHNNSKAYETFKLKSFHIEQALFAIFEHNPGIDIFDAIFAFFCEIPQMIARPQIRDRANQAKFIDDYVNELSAREKQTIVQARDFFLLSLEDVSSASSVTELLKAGLRVRATTQEKYLFDSKIPVFLQSGNPLRMTGTVLQRTGGFRSFVLDTLGIINVDRKIAFEATVSNTLDYDLLKWKVKNDDAAPEPRGEITDHSTKNNPESTRYRGAHFVECYAIKDGVCVAKARQNVVLRSA